MLMEPSFRRVRPRSSGRNEVIPVAGKDLSPLSAKINELVPPGSDSVVMSPEFDMQIVYDTRTTSRSEEFVKTTSVRTDP